MSSKEAFRKGIIKWANSVQINEDLRALADINAIVGVFYEKGYSIEWELNEIIEKIEEVCKKPRLKNNHIKTIKSLIKKYYEEVGREVIPLKPLREMMIKHIRKEISKAKIPANYIIISKLKYGDFLEV